MKKVQWHKAGVIIVVLLLISGIYVYKNVWNKKTEMPPILAELQKEYEGRVIIEIIDIYKEQEKLKDYTGIRAIPTQILYDAEGK